MSDVVFNGIVVGKALKTGDKHADAEAAKKVLDDLGLLPPPDPIRHVFQQGYAFAKASEELYKRAFNQTPPDTAAFAPFVVNVGFALEMYLKALCLTKGKVVKGHDLVALYSALPPAPRQTAVELGQQLAPQYKLDPASDLLKLLAGVKNASVDWRDLHEKNSVEKAVNPQAMIFLAHVFHDAGRKEGGF